MKTVKEIKEVYEWSRAIKGFSQNDMNELIFGILIGIAEHLEAQPVPTSMRITLASLKSAELKGMIEALRWVLNGFEMPGHHAMAVGDAIARLENGGDL